jgi:hypothetical protein
MLALSMTVNPECEHIEGDMRTLRLGHTFDAVFLHDAVMSLTLCCSGAPGGIRTRVDNHGSSRRAAGPGAA